ncbi:MAG: hypothetical protein F6K48_00550 [Okeania sp. SIO3H1]|uniref:hypothetical protein n=1 Tax=Okeania sp. SIO1I7 TaxID=2607772 RepID=UPI0013CC0EAD|nr:hypothetical protein [Okeania sp. SIO1I7]NEN87501.1 hypothetical protein [Okeania sp. SIO3H1]NET25689.1 hypothetical protein [Okeania sp. SIO1I7]
MAAGLAVSVCGARHPSQEGETGDRRQETGDNPPLALPPPRRGEMGMREEAGVKNCLSIFLP